MKKIAIVATSLDGCITKHDGEGATFTSKEDQLYFRKTLKTFDVTVMGANTFEASQAMILKSLNLDRLRVVWTRHPERYKKYTEASKLEFWSEDLTTLFAELEASGKTRCAILGGTSVYTECIKQNLTDELWLTLEPLAFGSGKRLFEGEIDTRLELLTVEKLSQNTLLLKYKVL